MRYAVAKLVDNKPVFTYGDDMHDSFRNAQADAEARNYFLDDKYYVVDLDDNNKVYEVTYEDTEKYCF